MPDINILLNDFATRCFRDLADGDYICARTAYRAKQIEQFHWMGLQAIEKYLKAILLYNKIKAPKVGHSLSKALEKTKQLPFALALSKSSLSLIEHLDRYGQSRYLEISHHIYGPKLIEFDKAVWEIRRYCRVLDYQLQVKADGTKVAMLSMELERIAKSESLPCHKFSVPGGHLEKILAKKDHPARSFLVWKNFFYGARSKKVISMRTHGEAKNSPLFLHPELLDVIDQYVFLPPKLLSAYRDLHAS
ncbi:HEPN domain-containing protein [Lysobacter humi (ex Lee et al. 2017)]